MEKYLDESLPLEERVEDLASKMTIEEKAAQMLHKALGVERLGIHPYNWWCEALHGVARAGTATVFPQSIGIAATFNVELAHEIADIISTEGRAKFNEQKKYNDYDIYKGITFWTPNINIFRDPRWGRGHETYGEDPYLTTQMGLAFVDGLQGHGKHLKSAACAKHFAVHSGPEALRHSFDATASEKDLRETYLPAFEALVKDGNVESVMGAYNRTNGEPCCGSKTLLVDILREEWGFKGHIVSDCWAVRDFHQHHKVTEGPQESVKLALENGCDLNCGCTYEHILAALENGKLSEEPIEKSIRRLLATWFKLGFFDKETEYDDIPYSTVACKKHREAALEAARQSMVMLKNDGILPLKTDKIKTIGVIGPNSDNRVALMGNYSGTAKKYVTVLEGITDRADELGIDVMYSEGGHLYKNSTTKLAQPFDRDSEVKTVCEYSDVIIMCLGLDSSIEGEQGDSGNEYGSGDKPDLHFPEIQRHILEIAINSGKPVILVSLTGSTMDYRQADEGCGAVIQAWYPGAEGGTAVAELLFGDYSPSGKLPLTAYRTTEELPDFTDYSMENRTYRYMKNPAMYPFGYGLSYTKFEFEGKNKTETDDGAEFEVIVKNTGGMDSYEKVQMYVEPINPGCRVPKYELRGVKPVFIKSGESETVKFTLKNKDIMLVDDNGKKFKHEDGFKVYISGGQPDERTFELSGVKPAVFEI